MKPCTDRSQLARVGVLLVPTGQVALGLRRKWRLQAVEPYCMHFIVYCRLTSDVDLSEGRVESAILVGGNAFVPANVTKGDLIDC